MKLKVFCFILLLLAAQFVCAQTTAPVTKKVISWGPGDCCANFMRDGFLQTTYKDETLEFQISVYPEMDKKYITVFISFHNRSAKSFTIYPDSFKMQITSPYTKAYNPISAYDVANETERRGQWRVAFARALAGMATQQSTATITDNQGNSANVVITEPNQQVRRDAANATARQQAGNAERADSIRAYSLAANTLFQDQTAQGYVFFKKEKPMAGAIISFMIGDVTYEVPFGAERTKLFEKKVSAVSLPDLSDLDEARTNELGETFEVFQKRIDNTLPSGWKWYSTDASQCLHYYNTERVTPNPPSPSVSVWVRQSCFRFADVMRDNKELNTALVKSKVKFSLSQEEMLCPIYKFNLLSVSFYDQTDKQIFSTSTPWQMDVPPDTNQEKLYKIACEYSKPTP
jgi:hypothetical protein